MSALKQHFVLVDQIIAKIKEIEEHKESESSRKNEREFLWNQLKLVSFLKFSVYLQTICWICYLSIDSSGKNFEDEFVDKLVCFLEESIKKAVFPVMEK